MYLRIPRNGNWLIGLTWIATGKVVMRKTIGRCGERPR